MKKYLPLFILFLSFNYAASAQTWVTVPDTNFVAYLQANYSSCMNGNQMNIDCPGIVNETTLYIVNEGISDISGLEYFVNLEALNCAGNQITNLHILPQSLKKLECYLNQLQVLPVLPTTLNYLDCANNQLTSLPLLPNTIEKIYCFSNQLTSLPTLPDSLSHLECYSNQLTSLPILPLGLNVLICSHNQLTNLPSLPSTLIELNCWNNQISSIPYTPYGLESFYCSNNQLVSIPALSANIKYLFCANNQISCFMNFPYSITDMDISGNPFTCLPNHISAMSPTDLALPLCISGDLINNPNDCQGNYGISGKTYFDSTSNCILDSNEIGITNIPLKLYDSNNNLLGMEISSSFNGDYQFLVANGDYSIKIDTSSANFAIQCIHPGQDTLVSLTPQIQFAENVNFDIACKSGIDIGVQSIATLNLVFPGLNHKLHIVAGNLFQWYNLQCATNISGEVILEVNGPVTYIGPDVYSITPTVSGNIYTFQIPDFGLINNQNAFNLIFNTDTTAQIGDQICVTATVSSTSLDYNLNNNNQTFCYNVINSWDPNIKTVYPENVSPGFEDWFTYTIHFQNTGTAPAMNIRLQDTLDNNLNIESFQVLNYSHPNKTSLKGNVLTVRFPEIMLPDSTSDYEGSQGFVQYRIKPKPNLPAGTKILNKAYIYFDYNAPIITNTTINEFLYGEFKPKNPNFNVSVYPNPSSDKFIIKLPEEYANLSVPIILYNLLGEIISSQSSKGIINEIRLFDQANGIYFLKVNGITSRLMKQ